MPKKLLSLLTVLAFVFSLIRIIPVHAEEYVEAKADKITSGVSESRMINGLTEEDWLHIMEEQEKLMTPEIRASIRENAMKSLEGKSFKNGDFAMKNAKPSDYGFKTQAELDKWLAMPFEPYKALSSTAQNTLSLDYTERAVIVNGMFCLKVSGYTNEQNVNWMAVDGTIARQRSWPGGNRERFVDGLAPGIDWIVASETGHTSATCTTEVISLNTTCESSVNISSGESLIVNISTSYSNPAFALRKYDESSSVVSISGNTITGLSEGSTKVVVYLVDRPTVFVTISVSVDASPNVAMSIDQSNALVYVGETTTLTATVTGTDKNVYWTKSLNSDCINVNRETGVVTGVSTGNGHVIATLNNYGISDSVNAHVFGITSLSATNITLLKGQSYQLSYAKYLPTNPPQIYYGINNSSIASMSYSGVITGLKAGKTEAGVWVNGHTGTLKWCNVTVLEPEITISNPGEIVEIDTGTFIATVAGDYPLVWSSSNSDIIRIDDSSTGAYSALNRGEVTITATIEGSTVSKSIDIVVLPFFPDESVTFSEKRKVIQIGETFMPVVTTSSAGATGLTLSFYCQYDGDIIRIDAAGVTGLDEGIARLYAQYGRAIDYMDIEVISNIPGSKSIHWDSDRGVKQVEMDVFDDYYRTYTRTASIWQTVDGHNVKLNEKPVYSSSNTDVAEVDGNGTVTAKSAGSATIYAYINEAEDKIISYIVNVAGPMATSGASFYRVPFTDVGGTSPRIDYLIDEIMHINCAYPCSSFNGTDDNFEGMSESEFCQAMASSKIFYFESHGSNDSLQINTTGDYITDNDIRTRFNIPNGGISYALSNTNLIILAACKSGEGSFGSAISAASPKIFVSMLDAVDSNQLDTAVNHLITHLFTNGSTISTAIYALAANASLRSYMSISCSEQYYSWTIEDILYN